MMSHKVQFVSFFFFGSVGSARVHVYLRVYEEPPVQFVYMKKKNIAICVFSAYAYFSAST